MSVQRAWNGCLSTKNLFFFKLTVFKCIGMWYESSCLLLTSYSVLIIACQSIVNRCICCHMSYKIESNDFYFRKIYVIRTWSYKKCHRIVEKSPSMTKNKCHLIKPCDFPMPTNGSTKERWKVPRNTRANRVPRVISQYWAITWIVWTIHRIQIHSIVLDETWSDKIAYELPPNHHLNWSDLFDPKDRLVSLVS